MLKAASSDTLDYIERAYKFVRDEIPHTWDAKLTVVSKKASDVLKNKTGICWTKACLLAARGNKPGVNAQFFSVRLAVLQSGWLRSDGRRKNNRRKPLYAYEVLRIVTKSFVRG